LAFGYPIWVFAGAFLYRDESCPVSLCVFRAPLHLILPLVVVIIVAHQRSRLGDAARRHKVQVYNIPLPSTC
jgi:hypothetical protein